MTNRNSEKILRRRKERRSGDSREMEIRCVYSVFHDSRLMYPISSLSEAAHTISPLRVREIDGPAVLVLFKNVLPALNRLVTPFPQQYIDKLCCQFITTSPNDNSLFQEPLSNVEKLSGVVHKLGNAIRNVYGCRDEYRRVEEVHKLVQQVELWLMDIVMVFLEGKELSEEHKAGRLEYQQASELRLHVN
jgi:hypothetical protein